MGARLRPPRRPAATAGAAGGAAAGGAAAWAARSDSGPADESERIASAADFRDDVPAEPADSVGRVDGRTPADAGAG